MAIIEINLDPSPRELRWFGLLALAFFGLLGLVLWWSAGVSPTVPWCLGAAFCAVYYAIPPLRRTSYLAWMYAVMPIGWVISHLLFAAIYYGAITPVGLLMRLSGRDPMTRRLDPDAPTYWVPRKPEKDMLRYFLQF